MTITAITGGTVTTTAFKQFGAQIESGVDATGGNRPPPPPAGGDIFKAVTQALSSIGALDSQDASNTSSDSGNNTKVVQAFSTFMNDLMGALHQHAQAGDTQLPDSAAAQRPPGPPPGIAQGSQNLLQQHDAPSNSGDISVLQSSFQSLLSAMGVTNSNATLENFLSALSAKMNGASVSGNVVNTQA